MAAAAILTAWAAFESAKWSGIQSIEFARASAARAESTRFDNRAGQDRNLDVAVFIAWLQAVNEESRAGDIVFAGSGYVPIDGTLSAFYYERMRKEFVPAFEAWIDTRPMSNPSAPPTPFTMTEYVLAQALRSEQELEKALGHTEAAIAANRNSDHHVLMAVALALVIFFAGVGQKLKAHRNRRIALWVSDVILIGAVTVLLMLPKAPPF